MLDLGEVPMLDLSDIATAYLPPECQISRA